jgi:hypothetical protein
MSMAWTLWMVELILSLLWFYLFGNVKLGEDESL